MSSPPYDVYLSFRAEDTGTKFVSHLYYSLEEKGIRTFLNEMVTTSEVLLVDAIRASTTAIVVISKNYASSGWCLDELTEILEIRQKGFLQVFPVYYGIEPSDVRNQTGEFGQEFHKIQRENPDKIQRWTRALTSFGSILGEYSHNWKDEAKPIIERITDDIWYTLRDRPAGMSLHLEPMLKLLALESEIDQVREIGIYGRVGIGKSTLASYVYQVISSYFDLHVLLKDVQELQSLVIISPDGVASSRGQRVLLLVDGVDTSEQIDIIRKHMKLFGQGSRVIVTCQDKHLLLACDIHHLYQVEPMTYSEALRLFSFRAFKRFRPPSGFEKLLDRAVKIADGIPSMIDAIGLELSCTSKEDWEMVLSRYEQSYDVFLSFIGEDTRRTFVSHLHRSLVEKGVRIADPSEYHLDAIERSEIALIVITNNYISSSWHFKELSKILECQRKGSLTVFPVYYGIESTDAMGNQSKEFSTHLGKPFRRVPHTLQSWSEVLKELDSIAGEHSNNWKDEAELIQKITNNIWDQLSVSRCSGLVGMHLHMERMHELLSLETEFEQVREIGIYGSVGIGKTTLARYVYRQIYPYFNTLLSLDSIGKIYLGYRSSHLQEELLWNHIQNNSPKESNVTKAGLRKCKVLLLVDGVTKNEQIDDVQKISAWFGPGSRVIFTCEGKDLLHACGVIYMYQVEPMAFSEALRLFSIHAFNQFRPPTDFQRLSERAVKLSDGRPLEIITVGSELFGKSSEEWEMGLPRYERASDQGILGTEGRGSGVAGFSKVSRRVEEELEMVVFEYEQFLDEATKGKEKSKRLDLSHGLRSPHRIRPRQKTSSSKYKHSSDEGTLATEEISSGLYVSRVSERFTEEGKMVLSKHSQSKGVSDDEEMSRTGNTNTFNFVGMDCHIQAVCGGLMELECDNEIHTVGIWGAGGVGKTTLARFVYEETKRHFHTNIFLENVGKIYQDQGSSGLKEELLWKYIQRSSKNVSDVTKARLQNRKVLLIVDGVDSDEQMENVQKIASWFGVGSRVIVTTRDENLLVDNGVRQKYEVKCLKVHEALQLFYQLAFKQQTPSIRFKQLSVRAVQLAGRIPLALEVLASFLRGKTENDWESVLQKLDRRQDSDTVEEAKTPSDVEVSSEEEEDDDESDNNGDVNETVVAVDNGTLSDNNGDVNNGTLSQPLKPSLLWLFLFITSIMATVCLYFVGSIAFDVLLYVCAIVLSLIYVFH